MGDGLHYGHIKSGLYLKWSREPQPDCYGVHHLSDEEGTHEVGRKLSADEVQRQVRV